MYCGIGRFSIYSNLIGTSKVPSWMEMLEGKYINNKKLLVSVPVVHLPSFLLLSLTFSEGDTDA